MSILGPIFLRGIQVPSPTPLHPSVHKLKPQPNSNLNPTQTSTQLQPHPANSSLQITIGLIILSLSGTLLATQAIGSPPTATTYNVFLSIWTISIAALGITATVTSRRKMNSSWLVKGAVVPILDTLSAVLTFAGALVSPLSSPFHFSLPFLYTSYPFEDNHTNDNNNKNSPSPFSSPSPTPAPAPQPIHPAPPSSQTP